MAMPPSSPASTSGPRFARAPPESPAFARTRRVSSFASSTFGWSNGSMPRTAPANAVATSHRTISPARSIVPVDLEPLGEAAGYAPDRAFVHLVLANGDGPRRGEPQGEATGT